MRKLDFKLVFIQWLAILFLIYGTQRFFYSVYAEEILNILDQKQKTNSFGFVNSVGQFLLNRIYWAFGISLLGIIIIAIINWKRSNSYLNTLVVSILVFLVWPTGVLFSNVISKYFNSFEGLFSKNYTYSFFIGGITLTLISSILFWRSYGMEKGTAHNSGLA